MSEQSLAHSTSTTSPEDSIDWDAVSVDDDAPLPANDADEIETDDGCPAVAPPPSSIRIPPAAPTLAEPFRGLRLLPHMAMYGAARVRELAAQPIEYTWDGYAAAGTIAAIAGPSSGGKTTLLFLLMVARGHVGTPLAIADRVVRPAPPGRCVVLIEGEHGEGSAARKLLKSAALLGLDDRATDTAIDRIVTFARKAVTVGSPAWKEIEKMISAGIVSDVAIDTIARVAPGDANEERAQVKIFEHIAQAIEKGPEGAQPVVWLVAHTRKLNGKEMTLDDVSGSSQRVAQSDSVIGVTADRDENDHVVSSRVKLLKDREDADVKPVPMTLEVQKSPPRLVWSAATGPKKTVDVETLEKVRAYIVEQGHVPPGDTAKEDLSMRKDTYFAAVRLIEAEKGAPGPLIQARPMQGKKHKGWDLIS